ncbi:hypothetical protein PG989_003769 [Apiospora arundinis]
MTSTATPFPFLELPTEIQLIVLEYTDLVTPLCTVTWRLWPREFSLPNIGRDHTSPCEPPYDQCHPSNHLYNNSRLENPPTKWPPHASEWDKLPEYRIPDDAEPFRLCPHAHNVGRYGLLRWSEDYRCQHYACQFMSLPEGPEAPVNVELERIRIWQPPTSLFLVSRSFRDMCSTVFYGRNRFHLDVLPSWYPDPNKGIPQNVSHDQAAPIFFLRAISGSAMSALRTLRINFADWNAQDRTNPHHSLDERDPITNADAIFTEYAKFLHMIVGKLQLQTLVLTLLPKRCNLWQYSMFDEWDWIALGRQEATKLVRQIVVSRYWPPLKDHPLSVLGGGTGNNGGSGRSERLLALLDFGTDCFSMEVLYVRRQLGNPVPKCILMYHLGTCLRPFWSGPHRVSDGEPTGLGDADDTVIDEVFFEME